MRKILSNVPKAHPQDIDDLTLKMQELIYLKLYAPIFRILKYDYSTYNSTSRDSLSNNAADMKYLDLLEDLKSGKVRYWRGHFRGDWNSRTSSALRGIGAKYSRKTGTYRLTTAKLPVDVTSAIGVSENYFEKKLNMITKRINSAAANTDTLAKGLDAGSIIDRSLWRSHGTLQQSLEGIAVKPSLTDGGRRQLTQEYNTNMQRDIKHVFDDATERLRERVETFWSHGGRSDELQNVVSATLGVDKQRAAFIAKQELRLLTAKYRESKYLDAGSIGYYWKNVKAMPSNPVRPMHAELNDKFIYWADPPVTDVKGNKNHAGEDYNCRCVPRPLIEF